MAFNIQTSSALLARTPLLLRAQLSGLPAELIHRNEGPGTWSAYDVVGHLLFADHVNWIPRTLLMLSDAEDKHFASFDREGQYKLSEGKSLDQLLEEFQALRTQNLEVLNTLELGPAQLAATGIHPALETVTVEQVLSSWVAHDYTHLFQVNRVIAKHYTEDVGPLIEFLPILTSNGSGF
jgi:hypothetical protein